MPLCCPLLCFSARSAAVVWLGVVLLATVGCGGDGGSNATPDADLDTQVDVVPDVVDDTPAEVSPPEDVRRDVPVGPPRQRDGQPCDRDDGCFGNACIQGERWPGGYCSRPTCGDTTDCDDASACVSLEEENRCLVRCDRPAQCRAGYACLPLDGDSGVCAPAPILTGAVDGQPCAGDEDCRGGTCFQDPEWPEGYCTTLDCASFADCAREDGVNNRCLFNATQQNYCVRVCATASGCREGYECRPLGAGQGFCAPKIDVGPLDPVNDELPFDVFCPPPSDFDQYTATFEIAEDTGAWMFVPFARDGSYVLPRSMVLPDGRTIDLGRLGGIQQAPSAIFGFINPLVTPMLSTLQQDLVPGEHTIEVLSPSREFCWFVIEESKTVETQIRLVVYLTGLRDVTAATAPLDRRFTQLFEEVNRILEPGGLSIREVIYRDVPEPFASEFAIIRNINAIGGLVALSQKPGDSMEDVLSMNLFFTRLFSTSQGIIGLSQGLPGPAGLHGTPASGVAFTAEYLDFANVDGATGIAFTAQLLVHEVGHYLGLFHTTEQGATTFDPLADTPQCSPAQFPSSCPDRNNLMFPFAGAANTQISAGQFFQLRAHPLSR